jgi:hypothetical protein
MRSEAERRRMKEIAASNYHCAIDQSGPDCELTLQGALAQYLVNAIDTAREQRLHPESVAREFLSLMKPSDLETPAVCQECGNPTASQEGICYQCQCTGHAQGWFDMDGEGYTV